MPRTDASLHKPSSPHAAVSAPRAWAMRLVAMLCVPALILAGLELGLRLAGYGHPTNFFEKKTVDDVTYHYVNHRFGNRFFPPAIARSPIPQRISVDKPSNTYRIVLFGESAANGDPDPAYGVGRHLEILLEERFPEADFEVVCTAITAINSHVILPIAREAADLDADLWIVYMGNNEMIGPYGASTVFGSKAPSLPFVRASLALKATRLGQLIGNLARKEAEASQSPQSWGGIGMFSENLLRPDASERLQVYDNFAGNLESILKAGKAASVPVVLSTVASNLLHCAPFASLNSDILTPEEQATWDGYFEAGREYDATGAFAQAIKAYEAAAAIDATHAELHYRLGSMYGQLGNLEKARELLNLARDLDALVVRADTRINDLIEETAKDFSDGVIFLDTAARFAEDSFAGLPGRDLFYEHVHFTLAGNYKLAQILGDQVETILPERIRKNAHASWIGPRLVHRRLAATLWDQRRVWAEMLERLKTPPYNARSGYAGGIAYAEAQVTEFGRRINTRLDREAYEEALLARPDDYFLRARFGSFLSETDALDAAIIQLQWVCETFPDFEGGFQELGIAQFLAERYADARRSFERVLEIRPGYPNALKALELMNADPRYHDAK